MEHEKNSSWCINSRRNGSMTLFLTLVLAMVFSLFFSLLEAARVQGLDQRASQNILLEMESALGEYQTDLWKNYRLLFLDGGSDTGEMDLAFLEGQRMEEASLRQKGKGFYQMALQSIEITEYALATDNGGAAFEKQACKAIQEQLAAGAAEALKQKLEEGGKMAEESKDAEKQWDLAKDAMTEAEDWKKQEEADPKRISEETQSPMQPGSVSTKDLPENPVNSVDLLKKSAILALVVENPAEISAKCISLQNTLGQRQISQGNMEFSGGGMIDKVWFLQYLNYYFSCGTGAGKQKHEKHALDYELEYCIAGKSSDQENLEKTVKELLLIREAGNFAVIMQDGKKQALALEIATAAVGFTGIPPLIQAVQIGILLAWSYIESILDVRCLLSGGKIPLIKQITDWKSDVSLGGEVLKEKKEQAESQEEGFDYRQYLQILLLLVKEETLVLRAMDVIEQNVRQDKPDFRMDHQIHGMQIEGLYRARPLFLNFLAATKAGTKNYHFRKSCRDFYLK